MGAPKTMHTHRKIVTKNFFSKNRTNLVIAGVVALSVALAGYLLVTGKASGFFAAVEPDDGNRTANAKLVDDSTASGGRAIAFTAATPPPTGGGGGTPPPTGCPAGQIGTPPNCFSAPPVVAASGKQWKVNFSEEFNGSDYSHSKLTPCFDWNYGGCTSSFNGGREHYEPSQVQVNNGTAKLVAQPNPSSYPSSACLNGQCTYLSGLLSTARPRADNGSDYLYKFTYGYVESRMKIPATQGFFTAFWMLPTNTSYNYRSEIDILEQLGHDPTTMYMTYHYDDRSESYHVNSGVGKNGSCVTKDYSTDFHNIGLDWQPDHIAWYIDGVKCAQFNGNATTIENGPMQIIIDLMVDHQWQRDWGYPLLNTSLTRQLELDYLRVYQQE